MKAVGQQVVLGEGMRLGAVDRDGSQREDEERGGRQMWGGPEVCVGWRQGWGQEASGDESRKAAWGPFEMSLQSVGENLMIDSMTGFSEESRA